MLIGSGYSQWKSFEITRGCTMSNTIYVYTEKKQCFYSTTIHSFLHRVGVKSESGSESRSNKEWLREGFKISFSPNGTESFRSNSFYVPLFLGRVPSSMCDFVFSHPRKIYIAQKIFAPIPPPKKKLLSFTFFLLPSPPHQIFFPTNIFLELNALPQYKTLCPLPKKSLHPV